MTATDTQPVDLPEDRVARPLRRGTRRRPADRRKPAAPPRGARAARLAAAALPASRSRCLPLVVVVENVARLSVPLLVQRGIDHGIPPIVDGGSARTLMVVVGTLCGGGAGPGHQPDVLPAAVGPDRSEGAAGVAAPGVPAFPAARHRVPRPLHVGAGGRAGPPTTSRPSRTCWRRASTA